MKRRSSKKLKAPKRHNSKDTSTEGMKKHMLSNFNDNEGKDLDDCSNKSNHDSLSSKLQESTLSTVGTEESDSDSDCNRSFFIDAISAISEQQKRLETESPRSVSSKKRDTSKKKKKKKKDKSPDKKKKKKDKSPDKPKKKSKAKRDKSAKSPAQCAKDQITEVPSHLLAVHEASSDDDSFLGEAFCGTHRIVPQIQQQEQEQEEPQELPYGPQLWGDTDDEKCFEDAWEEEKSWNGWDNENDDKSEYIEETICDESHDGFSYYTIQSNDDLDMGFLDEDINDDYTIHSDDDLDMGFLDEDKEDDEGSKKKRVSFNECETVHDTLHICDFTKKEIQRTWFQQKDYEATVQGVKEAACSCETPRDTQTKRRKQRSLLSKTAETRGLEAWTPSGVQRFRYVKEAAFRAVWDEQQKQSDRVESQKFNDDDNEDDDSSVIVNTENLRQAYQRVSTKSLKEAQLRAKRDEEIATKLQPRSSKRGGGRRGSWDKAIGSSSRGLLDGNSSHSVSDNPIPVNSLPSCLRKQIDSIPIESKSDLCSYTSNGRRKVWFGESARGLARKKSDRGLSSQKPDRGTIKPSSDRSLSKKKPERGLFEKLSNRKENSDRGTIKPSSDRSILKKKPERGLFKKLSNRNLFSRSLSMQKSEFDSIAEESDPSMVKIPARRSSDLGLGRSGETFSR